MTQTKEIVQAQVVMNIGNDLDEGLEVFEIIHDAGVRVDVIAVKGDIHSGCPLFQLTGEKEKIIALLRNKLGFDDDGIEEDVTFRSI